MKYENGLPVRGIAFDWKRTALALSAVIGLALAGSGCSVGSDSGPGSDTTDYAGSANNAGSSSNAGSTSGAGAPASIGNSFVLGAEFDGSTCTRSTAIDVNRGNSPEAFVKAAYCQINGSAPSDAVVSDWSNKLRTTKYVRRIDVVLSLCQEANRNCALDYSDPWATQSDLSKPCTRKGTRDLGAVLMFWNQCPGKTNCQMDWANTHASGMAAASPLLSFGSNASGIYGPANPGFWRRELSDAAYAGVQFFLLNVYGPDLTEAGDPMAQLGLALQDTGNRVKVGLFDDTYGWGRGSGAFGTNPNLADTEAAAQLIYVNKWKPFFTKVPRDSWYLYDGRPLIYFYNAGTLKPQNVAAPVISRLRALFQADFGVSPFIAVDEAFFGDEGMPEAADARFNWDTFRTGQISDQTLKGVRLTAFMSKWDSLSRDNGNKGKIAQENDRLMKDDSLLTTRLKEAEGSQLTVIATWNDFGEGTGIARNYDYFANGQWQEPDYFMKALRAVQCTD